MNVRALSLIRYLAPLGAGLAILAVGALLIGDRAGLEADYFALGKPWQGDPVTSLVGPPRVDSSHPIDRVLRSRAQFSVRWTGWWLVEHPGRHRFTLHADDGGYLAIDGQPVVDSRESPTRSRWHGRVRLKPGFHRIEIGFYQQRGDHQFRLAWQPPGDPLPGPVDLASEDLFSSRPLAARHLARLKLSDWSRPYRQILGVAIFLVGLWMLGRVILTHGLPAARRLRERRPSITSLLTANRLKPLLLLALFVASFVLTLPLTGTIRGGDDTAYLAAASLNEDSWFFSRFGHVYLLKAFSAMAGGDPLFGVRLWWAFIFSGTVAALAVALASTGSGLQIRSLAVSLFVLLSQPTLMGLIGAGFADYSAMLFITAGVAVFLHARSHDRNITLRFDWHAAAVGALTVAAYRSKETGAVLLLLPALYVVEAWSSGFLIPRRSDMTRLGKQLIAWLAGALAVLLLFVALDVWVMDSPLFSLRGGEFVKTGMMNFPDQVEARQETATWWSVLWPRTGHPATSATRNLWVLVIAAAFVAGLRGRSPARRLLHLLPVAYLVAIILLYIQMPHPFSGRMLIPIVPTACLMIGVLAHDLGLDEIPARKLLRASFLFPTGLAVTVLWFLVVPLRLGNIGLAELLPVEALGRFGWAPESFTKGMVLPAALLLCGAIAALVASSKTARIGTLLVLLVALFGPGHQFNRHNLRTRQAFQQGELLLHPWRVFKETLLSERPQTVALSSDLHYPYRMVGATRSTIPALVLDERMFRTSLASDLPTNADIAIASRHTYTKWLREAPELAERATFSPTGFLVLVRPKEAIRTAIQD